MTILLSGLIASLALVQAAAGAPQQGGPQATPAAIAADTGSMRHANKRTPPLAFATRLTTARGSVHLDGKLDEPIWSQATAMTEFTQTVPHEGEPATERTDVRVVYDDDAVYVGARMFDSDRAGIRGQLARRDDNTEADLF